MLIALFGIEDDSLNLVVNLLILVLVVIWLALVYWTYADARRRIGDPVLVASATTASLFPFVGTIVYTILRPPEFLADVREREIETRAAELRLRRLTETSCPRCEHPIELSWLRCPECQQRLKDPCRSCGRPVDPRWTICPSCEAPVSEEREAAPAKRPRGRRRTPAQARARAEAEKRRAAAAERAGASPTRGPGKRRAERAERPEQREQRQGRPAAEGRPQSPEPISEQDEQPVERPTRRKPTRT